MSAFNGSGEPGMGAGPDLDDILEQMFGMGGMGGMGGMPGMGGMGGMPGGQRQKPRRTPNEEQTYEVNLEDLYKGKTVRFASTKNVLCSLCHGKGGKERATAKKCGTCDGQGMPHYLVNKRRLLMLDRFQRGFAADGGVPYAVIRALYHLQWSGQLLQPQGQVQEV